MRIFKGLENIHSVIDRHESEWRKEQGENPKLHDPLSIEEAVRRRLTAQNDEGSGRFSADRFLGIKSAPVKKKTETPPAPEPLPEPEESNEPEAVEVIKNKDGRHSWLYNEVMKAINDASKGSKNTKIIAVFVPVVQNGKEFEELPFDQKITVQPVNEEDVKLEALPEEQEAVPAEPEATEAPQETSEEDFNLLPEGQSEPDEELAEAFMTMEEKLDEAIAESSVEPEAPQEEIAEPEDELPPEAETLQEDISEPETGSAPEDETVQEEINEPEIELPSETETVQEEISEPEEELPSETETVQEEFTEPEIESLPEPEAEAETEAEILQEEIEPEPEVIPENNDDDIQEEQAEEQEQEEDADESIILEAGDENVSVPEIIETQDELDEAVDGEPLAFEDIDGGADTAEELSLPEMLDDDEVDEGTFDESLTEVQKADDDEEEAIIIEEVDEPVEIVPDPEKK